jgi:hypothetical protein
VEIWPTHSTIISNLMLSTDLKPIS